VGAQNGEALFHRRQAELGAQGKVKADGRVVGRRQFTLPGALGDPGRMLEDGAIAGDEVGSFPSC
jgi:hypothetical protein